MLDYRHGPIAVAAPRLPRDDLRHGRCRARRGHRGHRRAGARRRPGPAGPAGAGAAVRRGAGREPRPRTPTRPDTSPAPSSCPEHARPPNRGDRVVPPALAPRTPRRTRRGHRRRLPRSRRMLGRVGRRAPPTFDPEAKTTITWWTGPGRRGRDDPRGPRRRTSRSCTRTSRSTSPRARRRPTSCCRSCPPASPAARTPTSPTRTAPGRASCRRPSRTLDITDQVKDADVKWDEFPAAARQTAQPDGRHDDRLPGRRRQPDAHLQQDGLRRGRRRLPDRRLDLGRLPRRRQEAHRPATPTPTATATRCPGSEETTWQFWPHLWQNGGEILVGRPEDGDLRLGRRGARR